MPPRKRKSKAQENSTEDSDAFVPPSEAPQQKRARKAEPQRERRADGHDKDNTNHGYNGTMTWNQFQEKFNEKSKRDMDEYLKNFSNELKGIREVLLDTYNKSKDAMDSAGTKQAKSIAEACQHLATDEREKSMDRLSHPLFKAGQHIFKSCHNILAYHNKANQASASKDVSPPGDLWQADNLAIQEVLSYGRQYGEKLVDCAITLDSDLEVLKVDRDQLPETGTMAIDIFEKSEKAIGGETWGRTVAAQLNAVTALMETISK